MKSLGFQYDPFQHWEASADPHLGEYLVGDETFAVAWDGTPALIFAPAGGGKTAMRIYTARSCWVGLGSRHPFPIPYVLREGMPIDDPSLANHMQEIVRAGARALLVSLAFRPELVLSVEATAVTSLALLLHRSLPSPLPRYLAMLREAGDPCTLSYLVDHAYVLPDPPRRAAILEMCALLEQALPHQRTETPPPEEQFEELVSLLRGSLRFRSIFLLVDGVDALPETIADPARAVHWLTPLCSQAANWAERRIFVKGFLPIETKALLSDQLHDTLLAIPQAQLIWTPELLSRMLRERVYAASEGNFDSLDAISSSALRDVETSLVKNIPPLPREALVLVHDVLEAYARRTQGVIGQLEPEDLEAAIDWYQVHQPWRNNTSTTIMA